MYVCICICKCICIVAPRYVVFSSLLLLSPSYAQMSPASSNSRTLSPLLCKLLHLIWQTKFHTHVKISGPNSTSRYYSCVVRLYVRRRKDLSQKSWTKWSLYVFCYELPSDMQFYLSVSFHSQTLYNFWQVLQEFISCLHAEVQSEWERERERESMCACARACVCVRARVCACARARACVCGVYVEMRYCKQHVK